VAATFDRDVDRVVRASIAYGESNLTRIRGEEDGTGGPFCGAGPAGDRSGVGGGGGKVEFSGGGGKEGIEGGDV